MVNLQKIIPVLVAKDVQSSIEFYSKIGFEMLYGDENYASLGWDGIEIHISPMVSLSEKEQTLLGSWTSFRVKVNHIDSLYKSLINQNIINSKKTQLVKKTYGMIEFTLLDPSSVAITFYQE